ncbi:MAG TPA: O-antigen ligase family protein [Pyrinomonadaceae bacterium]
MSRRASIILERIIFYALLVLIVLVATPYGIVNPWRGAIEAIFECGCFVLGVLWMIEGVLCGAWVSRRHLLLLPLLILIAFAYAQTLPLGVAPVASPTISIPVWQSISFDPYETQVLVLKLMAYALTLGLLLRYTSTPGRLRILVLVVIGIGVASALFALVRQTTQRDATEFLFPSVRLERGYGQFVNRNHFAFLMEMALGMALGLIAGGGVRRERILLYLTAAIPVWMALVLSNSRGGILSMLCQLLLLALMFSTMRNPQRSEAGQRETASWMARLGASKVFRLTLVAFLLAATLIGIVWVGGEQTVSRFETISNEIIVEAQEAGYGVRRQEIWGATWRMIKDHPLTGVGLGGYWTAIPLYHNASGRMTPQQAHNDYLELLASGGVIGVLLCVWFLFLLIRFARATLRSEDPFRRAACFGALTGLFGISIHSLVDFGLHIPINALICLVLVAIAVVNGRIEEAKRSRIDSLATRRSVLGKLSARAPSGEVR